MRKHLRGAINRGVKLRIQWGRETGIEPEKDREMHEIKSTIESLERDLENKIEIKKEPSGIHAKILTYDSSSVLLTSYNLLAFGGTKKRDSTISGELGVIINSKTETNYWRKFFNQKNNRNQS